MSAMLCGHTLAADGAAASSAEPTSPELKNWDQARAAFQQHLWRVYGATRSLGTDARGRTLAQDVNEWVMPEERRIYLAALRTTVERQWQASQLAEARASMEAGRALLEEQERRLTLISEYWWGGLVLDRHRSLWRTWAAQVPADVAKASHERLAPLESALVAGYSPTQDPIALTSALRDLKIAYNTERLALVGAVSDQRAVGGGVMSHRERTAPCPAAPEAASPGTPAPGSNQPARLLNVPSPEMFYPAAARQALMSGAIVVRVTVAADGCPTATNIVLSSGAPELDEAALDLAEQITYAPAIAAGQAVTSQRTFKISFTKPEGPGTTPALPTTAPTDAELIKAGESLLERQQWAAARQQFEQVLQHDPRAARALADRGQSSLGQFDLPRAGADFDAALALAPDNAIALRGRGRLELLKGQHLKAVEDLSASLALEPDNRFALIDRAQAYVELHEVAKSTADGAVLVRLYPNIAEAYWYRAVDEIRAGHLDRAAEQGAALAAAYPDDEHALIMAGAIYASSQQYEKAVAIYDRIVAAHPSARSYMNRANHRAPSDMAGRQADVSAALTIDPHYASALEMRGEMQLDAGEYTGATQSFDAALQNGLSPFKALLGRGIARARSSKLDLAAQDIQAARDNTGYPAALNSICWRLGTAGVLLTEALEACDAALAQDPENASILDSRGFALLRLGRYAEAVASYDAALKRQAQLAGSLYGRGIAEKRLGDGAGSQADVQAALQADPAIATTFSTYGVTP